MRHSSDMENIRHCQQCVCMLIVVDIYLGSHPAHLCVSLEQLYVCHVISVDVS